jgi:hypothetical protein
MVGQNLRGIQSDKMQGMKAIITGSSGQDGAYLTQYLLQKNYKVTGILLPVRNTSLFRLKYLGVENMMKVFCLFLRSAGCFNPGGNAKYRA